MVTIQQQRQSTTRTGSTLFLHLVILLLTLLALSSETAAAADTYTVSSDAEVPLRRGHGAEYKTLAHLQNGETVTSLEEDGEWMRVRTATGMEGWVFQRYLSSTPSAVDDAFSLPVKDNQTGVQPEKKATPLDEKMVTNPPQPAATSLPENSPPFQLNNPPTPPEQKRAASDKEVEELRETLARITMENKALRESERIKWFLAGGGVLVLGWLIGLITCKTRRRKPSLL